VSKHAFVLVLVALVVVVGSAHVAGASTKPDRQLLAMVAPSVASTCRAQTTTSIAGAVAGIVCTPGKSAATHVTYVRFTNVDAARRYYVERRRASGVAPDTETDCADLTGSESPYHTVAGSTGRVVCTNTHHLHVITWTVDDVVASALGRDDSALYTWWEKLVGRTLTPTQQALLAQLPGGIDRTTCHDNGDDSVKCLTPSDASDVYVVYFTAYPDSNALTAAYDAKLSAAGLRRDLRPSTDDVSTCNYETSWGPTQAGTVTNELGRIACFPDQGLTDLVWTRDDSPLLTVAVGDAPKALFDFFQRYSGASLDSTP
jgi:hypothetical protein